MLQKLGLKTVGVEIDKTGVIQVEKMTTMKIYGALFFVLFLSQTVSVGIPVGIQLAQKRMWTANDFEIGKRLGVGAHGTVYKARDKDNPNNVVALKAIRKAWFAKSKTKNRILREIEIQFHFRHPNIMRLYGFFYDEAYIYMVLEFAGKGTLSQELHKRKFFSEMRAATYIATVARALLYCHEKHVIHRDLKPGNVLVDEQGQLKLADFGLSLHTFSRKNSIAGTIEYLAPEMVREELFDASVDIWSLGVMCYEFLYGDTPFYAEELPDIYKRIKQLDLKFPSIPVISSNAKDLITKMLIKNASRRLSLHGVLEHSWIQENALPSGIFRR